VVVGRIKARNNCRNWSRVRPCGATLYQKQCKVWFVGV